jgi:uncharacterized SAM-binding protein YcdF (DUF218 family)
MFNNRLIPGAELMLITIKNIFRIISVILIISFLNACSYTQFASKKILNKTLTKSYDIVVIPGVPFTNEKWSLTMKARVYWSKFLYDKGIAKNVMYSGSAVYSPFYESEIMAMYAVAIGIPKDHIYTETKAQHSTENIYYSYKKAKKIGFQNIALASDPFQTKMLKSFIRRKLNRDVDIIPFVNDTLKAMQPEMVDPAINYNEAYMDGFVSLPDRESFWKRLKGTWGLKIDNTAYN